jgi:ribosome-binding protein aMBF1 (putative translation factor)
MKTKNNTRTLDELIELEYGKKGSKKREQFEKGFEVYKLGIMIQLARQEKGLTQQALAQKCGTNKAYISKVENNLKEVRLSTLQRIIEQGLGGTLAVKIIL